MAKCGTSPSNPAVTDVVVSGRRWFQRTYGNTYHTVTVLVNGVEVFSSARTYGYGDQYLQTAAEWLEANGYLEGRTPYESLRMYFERAGVRFTNMVQDVPRERDL